MKERLVLSSILLIALLFKSISYSQSGWFQQNSGITQPISKISFIDPNTGWCSSRGGAMNSTEGYFLKTVNGGQNWDTIIHWGVYFTSFHFINHNTGWLVGGYWMDIGRTSRNVYFSTNGGLNWQPQLIDSGKGGLLSVCFSTFNKGLIVGTTMTKGAIFRTTNAGVNWIVDSLSGSFALYDVYFIDSNTAFAVGGNNGQIFRTTNVGITWEQKYSSPGFTFNDVFFYNNVTGWVVGSMGNVVKTTNSGNNWYALSGGVSNYFNTVAFISPDTGFAGSSTGAIFRSVNGGLNWSINFQCAYNCSSIFFINSRTGWAAGGANYPYNIGSIYKTTTAGVTAVKKISTQIPIKFFLYQNYPNPFNPITKITFDVPSAGVQDTEPVRLIIYDVLGRQAKELVNQKLSPSTYEVDWDASNFSSGVYFYSLKTSGFTSTKKMILTN